MEINRVSDNVFFYSKPTYDEVKSALENNANFLFISLSDLDSVDDNKQSKKRCIKICKIGNDFNATLIDEKPIKTTIDSIGNISKTLHKFANNDASWDTVCKWGEYESYSSLIGGVFKKSLNFLLIGVVIYLIWIVAQSFLFEDNQTAKEYVDQKTFTEKVYNYASEYAKKYQFENEISATKVREYRKVYLKEIPKNFKDFKVQFISATTDSTGGARLTFKDAYADNIFYICNIESNSSIGNYMAGKRFMSVFYITGNFRKSLISNDYIQEESLTEKGSMLAPEFVVHITDVKQ